MDRKTILAWLICRLDTHLYDGELEWVSREDGIFRIFHMSKRNGEWKEDILNVYMDWAEIKNRINSEKEPRDYKHTFVQGLRNRVKKTKDIVELKQTDTFLFFQLLKKPEELLNVKQKSPKVIKTNQRKKKKEGKKLQSKVETSINQEDPSASINSQSKVVVPLFQEESSSSINGQSEKVVPIFQKDSSASTNSQSKAVGSTFQDESSTSSNSSIQTSSNVRCNQNTLLNLDNQDTSFFQIRSPPNLEVESLYNLTYDLDVSLNSEKDLFADQAQVISPDNQIWSFFQITSPLNAEEDSLCNLTHDLDCSLNSEKNLFADQAQIIHPSSNFFDLEQSSLISLNPKENEPYVF